jgi:hypothetical protein
MLDETGDETVETVASGAQEVVFEAAFPTGVAFLSRQLGRLLLRRSSKFSVYNSLNNRSRSERDSHFPDLPYKEAVSESMNSPSEAEPPLMNLYPMPTSDRKY